MKRLLLILFILLGLGALAFSMIRPAEEQAPDVLVSIAPQKFLVERIAGDTLTVSVLVPPGANPHVYEPSPRHLIAISDAALWFRIGESFEKQAERAFGHHNRTMRMLDIRQGLELIRLENHHPHDHEHHHDCSCHSQGVDNHVWLSPALLKEQARTVALALEQLKPEHAAQYRQNLHKLCQELERTDSEIRKQLQNIPSRALLTSHPALAYFCRDYNLTQLSLELSGKEPGPKQASAVLEQARTHAVRWVFLPVQHNNKGAEALGKTIQAHIVTIDPYAENCLQTMRTIANHLAS